MSHRSSSSSSSSDYRRQSRSSSPSANKMANMQISHFIFLFIESKNLKSLDLEALKKSFGVGLSYCSETHPNLDGQFLQIQDADRDRKLDVVERILQLMRKDQGDDETYMLIPEKLVAFFIGTSGKAIKKLMYDANTDIIVLPEKRDSKYRAVKITGSLFEKAKSRT